tara:strand:- start:75 stop:311 length:237 start_codon:yes stop_codon:yes gene_type:complete
VYKGKKVKFFIIDPRKLGYFDSAQDPSMPERILQAALSDEVQSRSVDDQLPWPYGKVDVVDIKPLTVNQVMILFVTND